MKVYKILIISFLYLFINLNNIEAQTFEAGAAVGFNMTQIDGDGLIGWNRIGAYAGPVVNINAARKWQVTTGILFSQLGSGRDKYDAIGDYDKYRVNFVEVPLTLRFKDWLGEDDDGEYYRVGFEAGFSYGRLINHKAIAVSGEDISDAQDLNPNAFNIEFGATYFVNSGLGVNVSFARQLNDMDNRTGSILVNRSVNVALYYFL